jgi:quinol monooxygenase YgiN
MSCQVILELKAKPGCIDKVRAFLRKVLPDTRGYAACITLHAIQNQDDPSTILIVEQWATRQHYEKYLAWRTESGVMNEFVDLMAGPTSIRFFDYFGV